MLAINNRSKNKLDYIKEKLIKYFGSEDAFKNY